MAFFDTKMDNIEKAIKMLGEYEIFVGIEGGENALIGFIHENGSPLNNIPPRPFLHPGMERAQPKIKEKWREAYKAAFEGKPKRVLAIFDEIGQICVDSIREVVDEGNFVPLKDETVRRKMAQGLFLTPLVATGLMVADITYKVVKKNA